MGDDVVKVGHSVSYDRTEGTVVVNVTSYFNQTEVYDRAVLKNSEGNVLASASYAPTLLPAFGSINLTINLDSVVLASGQSYKVELHTTDDKYYTPVLIVYENVRTRASIASANTLLVEIQSFANQTIIFDHANINYYGEGYRTPVIAAPLSQAKLLPNENLSLTILYKEGFIPGNYTCLLYSSSPDPQYVNGAYAFFTVTGTEDCFKQSG